MEIVNIEAGIFEEISRRIEHTALAMEEMDGKFKEKGMGEWIDNQEACLLLGISPRALQTLRDKGLLAYSQISHKIYYRPEDVRRMIHAPALRLGDNVTGPVNEKAHE